MNFQRKSIFVCNCLFLVNEHSYIKHRLSGVSFDIGTLFTHEYFQNYSIGSCVKNCQFMKNYWKQTAEILKYKLWHWI